MLLTTAGACVFLLVLAARLRLGGASGLIPRQSTCVRRLQCMLLGKGVSQPPTSSQTLCHAICYCSARLSQTITHLVSAAAGRVASLPSRASRVHSLQALPDIQHKWRPNLTTSEQGRRTLAGLAPASTHLRAGLACSAHPDKLHALNDSLQSTSSGGAPWLALPRQPRLALIWRSSSHMSCTLGPHMQTASTTAGQAHLGWPCRGWHSSSRRPCARAPR